MLDKRSNKLTFAFSFSFTVFMLDFDNLDTVYNYSITKNKWDFNNPRTKI